MKITPKTLKALEARGIVVLRFDEDYLLVKPIGAGGNSIPGYREEVDSPDMLTDCPSLELREEEDHLLLERWDTVPGPGPGDFREAFSDEQALLDFVGDYFFGNNKYFLEKRQDELDRRNSIHAGEIKMILDGVLQAVREKFPDEEISWQVRTFHKVPPEEWRIQKFVEEKPLIRVETGFFANEMYRLRQKASRKEPFSSQELEQVASLLRELALLMKEK